MKKKRFFYEYEFSCLIKTFRIMRIMVFLLLASIFQTLANDAYAQKTKLSLNFSGIKLEDALREIEDHSEFFFLYNKNFVDTDRKVTLSVKNEEISRILDNLFSGTEIDYTITNRKIILAPSSLSNNLQQQKSVSGTVSDQSGLPLPGVTVIVKGTTQGTITDAEGKYSLSNIPGDATLIFSFVGMKTQEVLVSGKTSIDIVMAEDAIGIEEVVAVGYGVQKKVNLTGAVETVRVNEIKSRPITNASLALQGKVAGAFISQNSGQPGNDDATILIRGLGTFNNSSPLIIIDGMEGNLNDVNPIDIESVSVLKDAASTAIYGNRAANGVVLISTRKGAADKMQVDYTAYYGVQSVTTMPKLLKGVEYLDIMALAHYNTNKIWPSWYNDTYMDNYRNNVDPLRYPTDFDWVEAVFNPATIINNHVNLSGGNKRFQFSASVGYLDQDGVVDGNNSKKLSFRTNLTSHFLNDKLTINLNTAGHDQITDDLVQGMTTAMYYVYVAPSTTPMKIPGYGYTNYGYNWAATEAGGYRKTTDSPINVRISANFNITKGLDVNASYGIYRGLSELEVFAPSVYLYSYKDDGTILETLSSEETGLNNSRGQSLTKTFNAQTNYSKELFDQFQFSIMGGFESREYRYDSMWGKQGKL